MVSVGRRRPCAHDHGREGLPWRIRRRFQNRTGYVVLDQLRTVDQERLVKRLGGVSHDTLAEVLSGLQELFAE